MEYAELEMQPGCRYRIQNADGEALDGHLQDGKFYRLADGRLEEHVSFILIGRSDDGSDRALGLGMINGMMLTLRADGSQLELVDCTDS